MSALTKLISFCLAGLIVSALLFVFLIKPALFDSAELNQQINAKKTELVTLEQQIAAYKTAQSDLSKAKRKDEVVSAIVKKEDLVLAVKSLELAASRTGTLEELNIEEVEDKAKEKSPPVISAKSGLQEVPYQITITNNFVGTINFLSYLEHLPQFTEVTLLTLAAEKQESEVPGGAPSYTGRVLGSINGVFFVTTSAPLGVTVSEVESVKKSNEATTP